MTKRNRFLRKLNHFYRNLGTWKQVAEYIGVNDRTLRRYWEGTRNPRKERIERFV